MSCDSRQPRLHTLTGIQPRSDCTMHIYVFINGTKLRALLDSGSTHNFVGRRAGLASCSLLNAACAWPWPMETALQALGVAAI
jgi:hypothetical protein